jgi:hypothetical protein
MNKHISVAIFSTRYNVFKKFLIKTNETKHEYAFNRSEKESILLISLPKNIPFLAMV